MPHCENPGRAVNLAGWLAIMTLYVSAFLTEMASTTLSAETSSVDSGLWGGVVKLPPYMVEDDAGRPWLVAKTADVEVLSRCSEELTEKLIDRHQRLLAMLSLILPDQLQPKRDLPAVVVLEDVRLQTETTRELTEKLRQRIRLSKQGTPVTFMPNFHFWDADSQVIYFPLDEYEPASRESALSITPAYLRYLLESRTPALPRWFIEGMVTLQKTIVLPVPPVARRRLTATTFVTFRQRYPYDTVSVQPFIWLSPEKTKEMHNIVKRTARSRGVAYLPDSFPFLPLERMLTTASMSALDKEAADVLPYQAALFIRWALDPDPQELRLSGSILNVGKPGANALWNFVSRSSAEPFSPELFAQSFGKSIDAVEDRLRGYLPFACLKSADFVIKPATPPDIPKPEINVATPLQISLLRGRFERLVTNYVNALYPDLTAIYADRARRTLHRAYKMGDHDPKLIAEMGLCEVDAGNDAAARPLLATAVQRKVVHPRVYLEFARIEYAQLIEEHPDLVEIDEQVKRIESLLETSFTQNPILPGSYELLFEIWLRQKKHLSPQQLAKLHHGPGLFPRHFRIVYAAALLHAAQGNITEAQKLVERSLPYFSTDQEHQRLKQLQQMMVSNHSN